MLPITIVEHVVAAISAQSLMQHVEANVVKRLLWCVISTLYLCFITLNAFVSQQVAVGWLQAASRPAIIYVNLSACLFMFKDRVSSVNMSVRQFSNFDKVVLPVRLQQNLSIMANVANSYLTLDKVGVFDSCT